MRLANTLFSVTTLPFWYIHGLKLPPQTVLVDVRGLAVLGANGPFRDVATTFNPTNTSIPFFQVWDEGFLDILGPNPSVKVIAARSDFAFAHEAPIWDPKEDQVFFSTKDGGRGSVSDIDHNNEYSRISLKDVQGPDPQNITVTKVPINPEVQMINGGTPFGDKLLLVGSGRGNLPPVLSLVNPRPPFNATVILDNFHGRQFNSLNDAKVHPKSGAIFFTDAPYGFVNAFRPALLLPNQVYRLNPQTRELRMVADRFDKCNGIAFSPDGSTVYISDSGASVTGGFNSTEAATIYAYDVDSKTQQFVNRRTFAWIDTGIADGMQVDRKGNVYASCGDGVQVFNPAGTLLGKIVVGDISANNVFAGKGRLVVLAEFNIYLVEFAASPSLVELQ